MCVVAGAKEIDIAATLEHLRDQRPGMVQTKVLSASPWGQGRGGGGLSAGVSEQGERRRGPSVAHTGPRWDSEAPPRRLARGSGGHPRFSVKTQWDLQALEPSPTRFGDGGEHDFYTKSSVTGTPRGPQQLSI